MTRRRLLAVLALLGACSLAHAEDVRRDGNWWRTLDQPHRLSYTLGFFDGMVLGNDFSIWGLPPEDVKPGMLTVKKVLDAYSSMNDKYLKEVTNGQLTDGLNAFYEDFRNRRILVFDGIWLVVNQISGKPEKEMQTIIENFRRNAAER